MYDDAPYDYFRVAGNLIFSAGACPLGESGHVVAPGDFERQAARAVENLVLALAMAGSDLDGLLETTIYVASGDRSDLVWVWQSMASQLGRAPSSPIGVSVLGYPDQLVETVAVARAAH